ncbi:L domain-like protein [Piromyces finnis]|uniref:L domain-like protein n=1 Tax=Piromyces finnis TaxID=1754191 RepID=A0A1Y1UYW4_9FUNG|nr:L domain-like protein [Piromyces finnis]|eukprot:ORX43106.1 L domain-like protein [Piromyces finnis]
MCDNLQFQKYSNSIYNCKNLLLESSQLLCRKNKNNSEDEAYNISHIIRNVHNCHELCISDNIKNKDNITQNSNTSLETSQLNDSSQDSFIDLDIPDALYYRRRLPIFNLKKQVYPAINQYSNMKKVFNLSLKKKIKSKNNEFSLIAQQTQQNIFLNICQKKDLNLINSLEDKEILKKNTDFSNVEKLIIKAKHLEDVSSLNFQNLKELYISITIESIKEKRNIKKDVKIDEMRQLHIEDLFMTKNRRELTRQRIKRELQKEEEKKRKKLLIKQKRIKQLSIFLSKVPHLKILSIRDQNFESLPSEIWNLKNLKYLILKKLRITDLPRDIEKLKNLKKLDLSNNNISTLPNELGRLLNLKELSLIGNRSLQK